jgi:hypothetical protein
METEKGMAEQGRSSTQRYRGTQFRLNEVTPENANQLVDQLIARERKKLFPAKRGRPRKEVE